ncbi:MAG: DNA helicase [Bacteroidales bacterium]|nr:DNA helicase [Bacteroidales bacterium]
MPQSPEAEKVVLGTLITDSNILNDVRDILPVDAFYITKNKDIYQCVLDIADRGERVDIITVVNECQKKKLDVVPFDIAQLQQNYTPIINDHVGILVEKYRRRKLFEIGAILQSNSYSEVNSINEVLSEVKDKLDGIFSSSRESVFTIRDAVQAVYDNIDKNLKGGSKLTGSPTGFSLFDKRSGGLQTSDLIIIAADSSQGKTSLAIKLAMNCGCPVAFYSMEMKKEQVAARMISIESGIPSNEILYSKLLNEQIKVIDKGVSQVIQKPIYFDDRSTSNIDTILSSIRMMKIKYGIKGVIVDYLQILNVNMKGANKEQQMGDVARRLKNIAKELDIWVIALSQLSRDSQNPAPSIARLRDSGQIAETADMVILIYRPEIYGKKYPDEFSDKSTENTALIDVAKGRNTGLMKFLVGFDSKTTNFYEMDRVPIYEYKTEDPHGLPF